MGMFIAQIVVTLSLMYLISPLNKLHTLSMYCFYMSVNYSSIMRFKRLWLKFLFLKIKYCSRTNKMCVCVCLQIDRQIDNRQIERERFETKWLMLLLQSLGKSKINRVGEQARNQRTVAVQVQRQSANRISSCLGKSVFLQ